MTETQTDSAYTLQKCDIIQVDQICKILSRGRRSKIYIIPAWESLQDKKNCTCKSEFPIPVEKYT